MDAYQPQFAFPNSGIVWERVRLVSKLKAGDHISYYKFPYYHHAIVDDVDQEEQVLTLLGWSLWHREIVRRTLALDVGGGCKVYRAVYTKGCYKDDMVLQRARTRVGEREYNVFTNFARAFPRWCKIGHGGLTHDDREANDRYLRAVHLQPQ